MCAAAGRLVECAGLARLPDRAEARVVAEDGVAHPRDTLVGPEERRVDARGLPALIPRAAAYTAPA